MTGIINFQTFLFTGIFLNLTPGNDSIFILTKSIAQGKKAGMVSALGIGTGSVFHTIFAAFGLSIIIAKSILLFSIIKYAGAAYLVYIGFKMITEKDPLNTATNATHAATSYLKIYKDGILTNILNPKVALFFIAFLPQFIDPDMKNAILPFLFLGATFILTGTVWCFCLAIFASTIFARLKTNSKVSSYINKFCGATLVLLGVKVAFMDGM
jgi:RhtB (resistance to homoserine/threonine) family protein